MLPRVAAAISQFIKPVSTVKDDPQSKPDQFNQQFKKFKDEGPANLSLVVDNTQESSQVLKTGDTPIEPSAEQLVSLEASERARAEKKKLSVEAEKKSPVNPMLALFQTLKSPGQALARKIRGVKNYKGGDGKKKMKGLKKGGIVDDQVY